MEILDAVHNWSGAVFLRSSGLAYLLTNAAHILSIALLIGPVLTLDLVVLGLFRGAPLPPLNRVLARMGTAGFLLALLTGLALFSVRPAEYAQNPAFLAKLAFILVAAVNFALLLRLPSWRVARAGGPVSGVVRTTAILSILLWLGAVVSGRWIGFI